MPTIMLNGRQVQVNDDSPLLKNNQVVSSPASGGTAAPNNPAPVYGSNISGFTGGDTYTPLEFGKKQIADYGQQWKDLTSKGDKTGAADIAAKSLALGQSLGGTRDSKGVWQFGSDPYAWAKDSVLNELNMQKKSVEDEIARLTQANAFAVGQNNNMLQEQLQGLGEQKAKTDQNIINFQNRRGGFYSGGTDFHMGNNAKGFAQAEGGLRRDVAARNADIWGRNALLAQQASEKISMLSQQAPGRIRELIMGQQKDDRQFALQESGVTGMYNGQPTYERVADQRNFEFQKAQQDWENNYKKAAFDWEVAQQIWERTFKEKNFEQDMKEAAASRGLQWANLGQREKEFIADQAFREKQFQLEKDKFTASQSEGGEQEPYKFNTTLANSLRGQYVVNGQVSNPQALRNAIIASGSSEEEIDALLGYFGLPTN